jgi:hypothetical protein
MAVALNPSTPESALGKLAGDDDWAVRKVALSNPKSPSVTKKEGCFVATAATGSYDHEITLALRRFRDRRLETSVAGRRFVRWYYQVSPGWAALIERRRWARFTIKWFFLYPMSSLVGFALRD